MFPGTARNASTPHRSRQPTDNLGPGLTRSKHKQQHPAQPSPLPTMREPHTPYLPVIHILLLPGIRCALVGLSVLVQQTFLDHHLLLTGLRATCNKSDCSSREEKSSLELPTLGLRGDNPGTSQANNYSATDLTLLQGPSNKSHKHPLHSSPQISDTRHLHQ